MLQEDNSSSFYKGIPWLPAFINKAACGQQFKGILVQFQIHTIHRTVNACGVFLSPFQRELLIVPHNNKTCLYLTKLFANYLAMDESLSWTGRSPVTLFLLSFIRAIDQVACWPMMLHAAPLGSF